MAAMRALDPPDACPVEAAAPVVEEMSVGLSTRKEVLTALASYGAEIENS
jgi:hypothetical protein